MLLDDSEFDEECLTAHCAQFGRVRSLLGVDCCLSSLLLFCFPLENLEIQHKHGVHDGNLKLGHNSSQQQVRLFARSRGASITVRRARPRGIGQGQSRTP